MPDEEAFLAAIRAQPDDDTARLVFADWLDDRDDPRGRFVRLHLALRSTAPDHIQRPAGEATLSTLRKRLSTEWLAALEPERAHLYPPLQSRPYCQCFRGLHGLEGLAPTSCEFHTEPQDTECAAWQKLCDLVEEAATDGRQEFAPLREFSLEERHQLVTLPPTIAKLKAVKHLVLYGSNLIRIPPEIGEMTGLEVFTPYTSYRLHWFPFEITRCANLRDSTVSTRAIYGNSNYHPPFPRLEPGAFAGREEPVELPLTGSHPGTERRCSVCDRSFEDRRRFRAWISLRVATDVLPLLVNACSAECLQTLPRAPVGYTKRPHRGGSSRQQQQTQF